MHGCADCPHDYSPLLFLTKTPPPQPPPSPRPPPAPPPSPPPPPPRPTSGPATCVPSASSVSRPLTQPANLHSHLFCTMVYKKRYCSNLLPSVPQVPSHKYHGCMLVAPHLLHCHGHPGSSCYAQVSSALQRLPNCRCLLLPHQPSQPQLERVVLCLHHQPCWCRHQIPLSLHSMFAKET